VKCGKHAQLRAFSSFPAGIFSILILTKTHKLFKINEYNKKSLTKRRALVDTDPIKLFSSLTKNFSIFAVTLACLLHIEKIH